MPAVVVLVLALLFGLMAAVEIAEGHAIHLAIIAVGAVAFAIKARFGSGLGLASATLGLVVVMALGVTHWSDGQLDLADAVYVLAALVLAGVVVALARRLGNGAAGRGAR